MFGKALSIVTGALGALTISLTGAAADPVADFYKGRTIKVTMPVGPGGTFGLHTLILAEHMGRHLPGNPTIVPEYMPGAGGTKATNYVYNVAPKDGTTIAMPYPAGVLAQHTQKAAVKFDMGKFLYIGRMADTTRVLLIWHTAPAQTIEDIKKTEVVLSASGKSSNTYVHPAVMNALIGTKFRIITGYTGAAAEAAAIERGEVHGGTSSWVNLAVNRADWLRDKKVKVLVQIGLKPIPELKGVPLLHELVSNPDDRKVVQYMVHTSDIGYAFMAPPDVPADRMVALRKAYADMIKDPRFVEDAKKRGIVVNYASGEELAEIVRDAIATPQALVDRFVALSN
jgi:tripartite-type tricarboxylate transporter receptor subunit TctC